MRPSSQWRCIINDLRREQSVSVRSLSMRAGLNRATVNRFLKGIASLKISQLESILAVFGYDLDAIRRPDSEAA
ncbi:helix-turn-helix transcriptional regulator [Mesorhizobium sp. SB112]|uniref:helix-turn-helix transcriptional regulator n=1 Tax=Mesorhizobium sp. SB112 TaxID=3151853 RepID=UPI0032633C1D